MKNIYEQYLSVLRAFAHGEGFAMPEGFELNKVFSLSAINSTDGIAAYVLLQGELSSELKQMLRRKCLGEMALYSKRAEELKFLAAEFNKNGIDCILFKGIILRAYYPVPELRTFSDVDMAIRKEDRQKCHELMLALGYASDVAHEPVYTYTKGTEYYEIHTEVMSGDVSDKADYRAYFSNIWEHVKNCETVQGEHIFELTPEFHFLYMLTHIAKHINASGAGIRMYLDVALFIEKFRDSADWTLVRAELKKLGFEDFANMVFTSIQSWFGIESPVELRIVDEDIVKDFLEFTLVGGVYGKVGRDYSLIYLKQQGKDEEKVSKLKTLAHRVFPPAKDIENRFTYLQKRPWLLPFAWVHRAAASKDRWGEIAENTKNIITADPEEVIKLKRIYKEIGL